MTRFTSTSMQALSSLDVVAYRLLFDIGITSGTLRFCTGDKHLPFAGNTYIAVSTYGGVVDAGGIDEESDGFPRDLTLSVAAVGSASLYDVVTNGEGMFNRPLKAYRVFLDVPTMTMVGTPELVWPGKIAEVNVYLEEGRAEVRAISALRKTAAVQYFNRETFRSVDSSDTFGDHIDQIPMFKSQWGGQPTVFAGGSYRPTNGRGPLGRLAGGVLAGLGVGTGA